MATYPVHVPSGSYRGKDPKRIAQQAQRAKYAQRIESFINGEIERIMASTTETNGVHVFSDFDVARGTSLFQETVTELLFATDGGSNGITVSWSRRTDRRR